MREIKKSILIRVYEDDPLKNKEWADDWFQRVEGAMGYEGWTWRTLFFKAIKDTFGDKLV